MPPKKPAGQVCPICGHEDNVKLTPIDDSWIFSCNASGHDPLDWSPTPDDPFTARIRSVLAKSVVGGFAEYGVVEHRFAETDPKLYRALVDQMGHHVYGPQDSTVSAYLARRLSDMARDHEVEFRWGKGTGFWSHNTQVSCWAEKGHGGEDVLSWAEFAKDALHVDPKEWPALSNA